MEQVSCLGYTSRTFITLTHTEHADKGYKKQYPQSGVKCVCLVYIIINSFIMRPDYT